MVTRRSVYVPIPDPNTTLIDIWNQAPILTLVSATYNVHTNNINYS